MAARGLIHGPLGANCLHLCVDMQRLFAPGSPWTVPWLEKVLPAVEALCAHRPERTVFTRFVPPQRASDAIGSWARYYQRWEAVTGEALGPEAVRLVPTLERFVPPARIIDKSVYSPWTEGRLDALLAPAGVEALVISGGETDVCVLATALGAIDRGFRVILATDALCSSSDATHDALMELYTRRFSQQVEVVRTEEVLAQWH
ncbi:cysteine hydrolase family protein [Ancylobacter polymorphus]|uniref:Cysteine hydrolase n=1 Tax=Ancylobacter polymorphus TaxID=223390 RepID=A0A9E6ZXW0_9HYPH|nr:isochorismatase family cysteine hydrolase [Ancylobacter polymorphus]UOK72376.1 cysteine hydrolase [Ancylobacter polymorphus]